MFIHFFLASSLRFRIILTTSTNRLCTPKLTPFLFKSTNPWDLAWPPLYATTSVIVLEYESFFILQSWNPNWVLYHSIILPSLKSPWFLEALIFLGSPRSCGVLESLKVPQLWHWGTQELGSHGSWTLDSWTSSTIALNIDW